MLSSCDRALHSQLPLFTAFLKLFRVHLEQVWSLFVVIIFVAL